MRTCMTRMRAGTMIQCGTTAKCIVTSGGLNQIMASAQKDLGEMRTEAPNMSIMQSPLSQMIMQSPMGDQVSQSSIRLSRRRRTVESTTKNDGVHRRRRFESTTKNDGVHRR